MSCALIHVHIGTFAFVNFCGHVDKGGIFNMGYGEEDLSSNWELSGIPSKARLSMDISSYMEMLIQGLEKSHICWNCC